MENKSLQTTIELLQTKVELVNAFMEHTKSDSQYNYHQGKKRAFEDSIRIIKEMEKDIQNTYYKMFNTQKEYTIIDKLEENLSHTDIPVPSYIRFEISTMNPERINVINNVNNNIFENLTIDGTLHLLEFINFQ